MTDDPERRREFTRWRISAEWAVPLDLPEFLPPTAA